MSTAHRHKAEELLYLLLLQSLAVLLFELRIASVKDFSLKKKKKIQSESCDCWY